MKQILKPKLSALSLCLIGCVIAASALSSCKQTKQMEEMHDSTEQMKNTTEKMNDGLGKQLDVTKQMEGKLGSQLEISKEMDSKLDDQLTISGRLEKPIEATYTDLRQGNGRNIRRDELIHLQNAKTMDAKLTAAAAYLTAFEFQLIKPVLDDNETRRAAFFASAAEEFLRDVIELMPKPWDFPMVDKEGDITQNAYAIAAALHFINPNSAAACKERKNNCPSMLDILQKALQQKANLETAPLFVKKVLEQEETAIYILKLRYVVLTSILVSKASPAGEAGISEFKTLLRGGRMLLAPWTPDLKHANAAQLAQLIEAAVAVHEVYDFLGSIHQKPTLPAAIKIALQNLRPQATAQGLANDLNLKLLEVQSLAKNSDCASNALFCLKAIGSAPN